MPVASPTARPRALSAARTAPLSRPAWTVLAPTQASNSWLGAFLVGLIVANLGLYVLTVVQETGLNRTQSEIYTKRQQNVRLRAELAAAEALDRVETRASSELGLLTAQRSLFMPPPSPLQVIPVTTRTAMGVPEGY